MLPAIMQTLHESPRPFLRSLSVSLSLFLSLGALSVAACGGGEETPAPEPTPCPETVETSDEALDAPLEDVPEIMPGYLRGYLETDAHPDSVALLPPPPAPNSAALERDHEVATAAVEGASPARFALATRDADLSFPAAASTFSCAVNVSITEDSAPHLYRLLRRILADGGLSTETAKHEYERPRPFTENERPLCTPEEEAELRADGSYPSGHTAAGWTWALVLAEIVPERSDDVLARGIAFGQSRIICNVHWQSDVDAGRVMGSAIVARLHADEGFVRDLAAAKREYRALVEAGSTPTGDCAAEAAALAETFPPLIRVEAAGE